MKLPTSGDGRRTLPALTRSELKHLQSSAGEAAALLKVLSNEKRLLILCTLAGGELSVSDLNARIPMSQSALSQHLSKLRAQNLVTTRRDAQTIYYSSSSDAVLKVLKTLTEIYGEETAPAERAAQRRTA